MARPGLELKRCRCCVHDVDTSFVDIIWRYQINFTSLEPSKVTIKSSTAPFLKLLRRYRGYICIVHPIVCMLFVDAIMTLALVLSPLDPELPSILPPHYIDAPSLRLPVSNLISSELATEYHKNNKSIIIHLQTC